MKKQKILSLCLASLLALSLAACNSQADEQDSTPPTASVQPTIKPTPTPEPTPPIPYTDVAEDSPYYSAVVWAYENGIASDGSTFEPDSPCTRGQVMTFLWRAKGSPEPQATESPFNDVSNADWFYRAALWANENSVATGTAFKPGNPCTNAEALTFLWRAEGKPAAAVHNSAVALAASGAYYARPAAWAETNGLFVGADFDPAAPCSRADLMTYLYWLTEEWAFTEEDKTVQAEYEQIINDAQLFEVHGSGLLYADYVDVDGDGKVELLTVDSGENLSAVAGWFGYDVTATVYTNIDGHAGKLCEQTFEFTSRDCSLYVCVYGGHAYIRYEIGIYGPHNTFYKTENGAFILSEQIDEEMGAYYINNNEVSETEYNAAMGKYTNQRELFWHSNGDSISVVDRGLLPSAEEYWYNYWMAQPMYAAVLNGDFSAFAGTYDGGFTLGKDGVLTGDGSMYATNIKPSTVTITDEGRIHCVLITRNRIDGPCEESYDICPIGVGGGSYYDPQLGEDVIIDASKVRIDYNWFHFNITPITVTYYKVS